MDLIITLNIWLTAMAYSLKSRVHSIGRMPNTRRITWMANNIIPDSIIANIMCWSLLVAPPVEPKVGLTKIGLTSKNTLRILNTIMPVTRAFTAMDVARLAIPDVFPQPTNTIWPCINVVRPSATSQVARGDKLKSTCQMKIGWRTQVYNCEE